MRTVLVALTFSFVQLLPSTSAADRPTSGDMSILSGRTLGNGELSLAGGLGWPGIWAQLTLAPSSTLNVGVRGGVLYGSPVMGFETGVGGVVVVPVRVHLLGEGNVDVALLFEPTLALGEGALAGQTTVFADNFGLAAGGGAGAVAGLQVSDEVTFAFGALLEAWALHVFDGEGVDAAGAAVALAGVEALLSRDTMLFGELRAGGAVRPDRLFATPFVFRLALGISYLL